jgi:hypothetical protein
LPFNSSGTIFDYKQSYVNFSEVWGNFNLASKEPLLNVLSYQNFLGRASRWQKKNGNILLFFKKPTSTKQVIDQSSNFTFWGFKFVDEQSSSNVKVLPGNTNFTLKQKRYKRRKVVAPRIKF